MWELAVAFSPKRSETAERRLGVEADTVHGAAGGRVYTEVSEHTHQLPPPPEVSDSISGVCVCVGGHRMQCGLKG